MAPSLRSLFAYVSSFSSPTQTSGSSPRASATQASLDAAASFASSFSTGAQSCPIDGPISCQNSTEAADSCCFVYPGGRMLLTQFWDAEVHARGSEQDWTIHGLWPDLCDGTYDAFCSMTPSFPNITDVLVNHEQHELLEYITRYWTASYGSSAHLWAHEYNKHGTCINTLKPSCYGDSYASGVEVVDYFTRAAAQFQKLDTYSALKRAGIVPSRSTRYPLADIQEALEGFSGGKVVLRCGGRGDVLHEAWYVYFVRGSLQTGEFVPAQTLGREGGAGNCKPWVRYLPKRPRRFAEGEDL